VLPGSAALGVDAAAEQSVRIPAARRVPRHIVIISLETAARKYYPLLDNAELPTFARMAARGISSDNHLSTNPATTWAIYSMLTGTYPRRGRSLLDYGDFASDGLASVLDQRGYETTFIDSYKIDWQSGFHRDHNSRMVKDLGFMSIEDITTDSARHGAGDPFDVAVERERRSLVRALDRIDDARQHHTHAFVFIATILGHFPWGAPAASEKLDGAARLAGITRTMDTLMGELLAGVERRGLTDSIIVVVTGDHGLRSKSEFASLGESMRFGTISFNVPFVLYAPGLFDRGLRLSHVTSHVDIAPTLFDLVGISADSLLLHGSSMLDPSVEHRTTFMLNNSLRPVDGYYRDGWLYVYNAFTGEARVERALGGMARLASQAASPNDPPSLSFTASVAGTLDRAAGIFDTTSAYFLQRRSRIDAAAHSRVRAAP
jgi:membrane-anchored protein YejM (alkaline phosphatase superfamily)